MRQTLLVMLLLLLTVPASTLYSDTTGDSARAAIEKLGSAIVWVKHTQPYEDWDGSVLTRESQTIGIFIDRKGTLVVRGHIALRDLVPYGFRVQWPDGTEAEAEYLGKDKNLNICFCRLKQPLPDTVAHFELGNTPTPVIAQKVFILTRRQQWDGSAFEVAEGRIASILPGARAACILSIPNAESFAGCPVFNEKGVFLGVIGFDLYQEEGGPAGAHPGYSLLYPGYSIAAASPVKPDSVQPGAGMGWIGAVVGSVEEKMARYLKQIGRAHV